MLEGLALVQVRALADKARAARDAAERLLHESEGAFTFNSCRIHPRSPRGLGRSQEWSGGSWRTRRLRFEISIHGAVGRGRQKATRSDGKVRCPTHGQHVDLSNLRVPAPGHHFFSIN
jgi:hypothetical protein